MISGFRKKQVQRLSGSANAKSSGTAAADREDILQHYAYFGTEHFFAGDKFGGTGVTLGQGTD